MDLVQSETDTLLFKFILHPGNNLKKRIYSLVTYEPRLQNQKWAQGPDWKIPLISVNIEPRSQRSQHI